MAGWNDDTEKRDPDPIMPVSPEWIIAMGFMMLCWTLLCGLVVGLLEALGVLKAEAK